VAEVALIGWIPVCVILFACLAPARALVLSYLGGWLLLPMLRIPIEGFWDIDKVVTTNAGAVLGAVLFAPNLLRRYRFCLADWALLAFAGSACLSSLVNGLGLYDGVSSASRELFFYAVPFCLGRALLTDRGQLLEAGRWMVFGAAVYALAALWEWRMSPQIHHTLYGVFQHRFIQHHRWGFFRPIVCFPHALSLGMFMAWASMLALWMYRRGQLGSVGYVPQQILVALPLLGLLASMSMSPWGLAAIGLGVLYLWEKSLRRAWILVPLVFALLWMGGRYTGQSDGQWLASLAAMVSEERAESLRYRIDAETLVLDNAKQSAIFGFGRGKHQTGQDETARPRASDGLWVILVGRYGLVGLCLFYLWWCWVLWLLPNSDRRLESSSVLMVSIVTMGVEAVNFLFNGVTSPLVTIMGGGTVSCLIAFQRRGPVAVKKSKALNFGTPVGTHSNARTAGSS
jgi:hypothetical protein